jgi:L-threonylcarbamoyladenylate synthase
MDFEKDIEQCLTVLKAGGLILYPTDTVWGIGCDATNADAVERVYLLKNKADKNTMVVLVADERDVLQYVASPDLALFDYLEEVGKPTTVIYEGAIGLAENLVHENGSIAIRICNELFCKHLIRRFRKPIVSASVNFSGEEIPPTFSSLSDEIKAGVNYIVTYRQDESNMAGPLSVIKWNNGLPEIIRL